MILPGAVPAGKRPALATETSAAMLSPIRLAYRAAAAAAMLLLGGCVTLMDELDAGTPVAEIRQRYGDPTLECPLPEGGKRFIWSRQPLGQYAWGVDEGADGKTGEVRPLLTDANFARLSAGYWPAERVRCEFGPPANVREIGMSAVRQKVWDYRYKDRAGQPSIMSVFMGPQGDVVRRHESGPDPMYDTNANPGEGE